MTPEPENSKSGEGVPPGTGSEDQTAQRHGEDLADWLFGSNDNSPFSPQSDLLRHAFAARRRDETVGLSGDGLVTDGGTIEPQFDERIRRALKGASITAQANNSARAYQDLMRGHGKDISFTEALEATQGIVQNGKFNLDDLGRVFRAATGRTADPRELVQAVQSGTQRGLRVAESEWVDDVSGQDPDWDAFYRPGYNQSRFRGSERHAYTVAARVTADGRVLAMQSARAKLEQVYASGDRWATRNILAALAADESIPARERRALLTETRERWIKDGVFGRIPFDFESSMPLDPDAKRNYGTWQLARGLLNEGVAEFFGFNKQDGFTLSSMDLSDTDRLVLQRWGRFGNRYLKVPAFLAAVTVVGVNLGKGKINPGGAKYIADTVGSVARYGPHGRNYLTHAIGGTLSGTRLSLSSARFLVQTHKRLVKDMRIADRLVKRNPIQYLSEPQQAAARRLPFLRRMFEGTARDRVLKTLVDRRIAQGKLPDIHITPQGARGIDLRIGSQFGWDLTTRRSWMPHIYRYSSHYAGDIENMLPLLYR